MHARVHIWTQNAVLGLDADVSGPEVPPGIAHFRRSDGERARQGKEQARCEGNKGSTQGEPPRDTGPSRMVLGHGWRPRAS